MSHIPERKEKDCLNCGTIVQGRYCQHCGQENVVPKETFWHMVTHFFYDITHFDSNFFHTVHHLVFKPGFLSKEYMLGRRATYLHPVKMYVFTSAIFFLLFFSVFKPEADITDMDKPLNPKERTELIKQLENRVKSDTGNLDLKRRLFLAKDSAYKPTIRDKVAANEFENVIQFGNKRYRSVAEYDSSEAALPPSERDGWLERRIMRKIIGINVKYREYPDEVGKKLGESILHRLPYMLFVSLPLFALILRLVYIRRKQFYFADHGVFTIHLYVFSFINLLIMFSLVRLAEVTGWSWPYFIFSVFLVFQFAYLYIAMKKFYQQGWGKTFIKFILVALLSLLMMMILFLFFIIFSTFTL